MKKEVLLSIIVPVYKVEEYLPKCLDSIINQTYKNLEIILIDDGSPDKCPKICDDYAKKDKRIKVIHKENGGVSSARNLGLDVAKGEFVTFVDSDDWIDETMYEVMLKKQVECNSDLVFSRYNSVANEKVIHIYEEALQDFCNKNNLSYLLNLFTKSKLQGNTKVEYDYIMCNINRIIFRRKLLTNIRFNEQIKFMEDGLFLFEIFLSNSIKCDFVDKYFYYYLDRSSSATNTKGKVIVKNSLSYSKIITNLFKNTDYENKFRVRLFGCYLDCVECKYEHGYNLDLTPVEYLNSKENYKETIKIPKSLKTKIRCFCAHHGFFFVFQIRSLLKKLRHK